MINKIMLSVLSVFLVVNISSCTYDTSSLSSHYNADEGKYIFRFAYEEIEGSVQDLYVKKFAQLLEEKSEDKIRVERYPINQIGDATQQTELLQNGGIDFAIVSPGNTGTIVPQNQLFSLHFLFSDDMEKNQKIFNESKALNEMLSAKYLEKDLKVLSYWTEGFMQWTSNKKIEKPDDFKGFKIRVMPSPMILASYEAYGSTPAPMPFMEVYSGLQLKMIDGQENPMFSIEEMKFMEVQKYLTMASSNVYVTTTCVNPKFFNELPEEYQNIILEVTEEMKPISLQIQKQLNDEAYEKIMERGYDMEVTYISEEQRKEFKEKSKSARDRYMDMVDEDGKKILIKLEEEIEQILNNL